MAPRASQLRGACIALLSLALGSACASGPSARKQEAARLDQELDEERAFAAPGVTPLARFSAEIERGDDEHAFRVMMRQGSCYVAQAGLGNGIKDAQLAVMGPTGTRLGQATQQGQRMLLEVCATIAGPHRVVVEANGRGPIKAVVYEKPATKPAPGPRPTFRLPGRKAAPSASASGSASGSASAVPSPSASSAPLPGPLVCSAVGAAVPFARLVKGEQRGCIQDDDCISVKTDCSHLVCTGVQKTYRDLYKAPIDCRGYSGMMGNYDCDPQFGIEAPRCRAGCCVSERIVVFAKPL